jgi:hypothetical protein
MELSWNKNKSNISDEWEWESKDPRNRASFMLPLNEDMQKIRESAEHGRDLTKFTQNEMENAAKNLAGGLAKGYPLIGYARSVLYYIQDALRGPYPRAGIETSPSELNRMISRIGRDLNTLKVSKTPTPLQILMRTAKKGLSEEDIAAARGETPLQILMRTARQKKELTPIASTEKGLNPNSLNPNSLNPNSFKYLPPKKMGGKNKKKLSLRVKKYKKKTSKKTNKRRTHRK